jgi:hypothetical protein
LVRVYVHNDSVWNKVSNDVYGEAAGDRFGYSIAVHGDTFAAGSINNNAGAGHSRVYKLGNTLGYQHPIGPQSIQIYPNPSGNLISIQYPEGFTVQQIRVLDMNGREAVRYTETLRQMDISALPVGCYVVQVQGKQGILNCKLLVQR